MSTVTPQLVCIGQEAFDKYMAWADKDDPWRRDYGSKHYEREALKRAIAAVVRAEREACAVACETVAGPIIDFPDEIYDAKSVACFDCAEAIRARNNPTNGS